MNMHSPSPEGTVGVQIGWGATSTLLGGLLAWGGIGWLLDYWWGTRFATPIGAILGMVLGIYAVVMRYGRDPQPEHTDTTAPVPAADPASCER